MQKLEFASQLKIWRRSRFVKQATLAGELGVSQTAISRWENGLDTPSPAKFAQLRAMMTKPDPLELERAFIRRQRTIRALYDVDGARLVGYSQGFHSAWPKFCDSMGEVLEHRLIGEFASLFGDRSMRRSMLKGDIAMMSGVSLQHIDRVADQPFKHRWHASFKPIDSRIIMDVVVEPAADSDTAGIESIVSFDEICRTEAS
jgi:transcriptional regulator with XRE-family HTH domain